MTIDEAKKILDTCQRSELRDHAFGDAEVEWFRDDEGIASGYFGQTAHVSFAPYNDHKALASFEGEDADALRHCGKVGKMERNDSTGYDTYRGA